MMMKVSFSGVATAASVLLLNDASLLHLMYVHSQYTHEQQTVRRISK